MRYGYETGRDVKGWKGGQVAPPGSPVKNAALLSQRTWLEPKNAFDPAPDENRDYYFCILYRYR